MNDEHKNVKIVLTVFILVCVAGAAIWWTYVSYQTPQSPVEQTGLSSDDQKLQALSNLSTVDATDAQKKKSLTGLKSTTQPSDDQKLQALNDLKSN